MVRSLQDTHAKDARAAGELERYRPGGHRCGDEPGSRRDLRGEGRARCVGLQEWRRRGQVHRPGGRQQH